MKRMNDNFTKIISILNDKQYHDGTSIGKKLNITRAAVWKIIKKLQSYGVLIKSVKGKGYILTDSLILLDYVKIKSLLSDNKIHLDVLEKTESTNTYLRKTHTQNINPMICIAETQTQGQGRLNRIWHSPFGQNIYLSLSYQFQKDVSELSGLSLIIGLAVCKAIEINCSLSEPLEIKWPNDIMVNQKKIAGILIEIQAEPYGYCNAIIGVGINVNIQNANNEQINQPWTSIRELNGEYQDRNNLCVRLIQQLLEYLKRFNNTGLNDFREEWESKDCLFNQAVRLTSKNSIFSGIGGGINEQGHLILISPENIKHAFASGDTTLLNKML